MKTTIILEKREHDNEPRYFAHIITKDGLKLKNYRAGLDVSQAVATTCMLIGEYGIPNPDKWELIVPAEVLEKIPNHLKG